MKKVLLLLCLAGLALLIIPNWGPPLSLVVFGSRTIALPVAIWILGAIAAGFLTSTLLQALNYRPLPPSQSEPHRPRSSAGEERRFSSSRRPKSNLSDWETSPPASDWDADSPAPEPATPKRRQNPDVRKDDIQQPPPSREPSQTTQKQDRVYDANYRVIASPYPEPNANEEPEDREDWGFDDEEFESEYRRSYRDRPS